VKWLLSIARKSEGGRKVRAPAGRMAANYGSLRREGKCHRKDTTPTAFLRKQEVGGKGAMAR